VSVPQEFGDVRYWEVIPATTNGDDTSTVYITLGSNNCPEQQWKKSVRVPVVRRVPQAHVNLRGRICAHPRG